MAEVIPISRRREPTFDDGFRLRAELFAMMEEARLLEVSLVDLVKRIEVKHRKFRELTVELYQQAGLSLADP